MRIRRRGWHGLATAGKCPVALPIEGKPTGNSVNSPQSPQGFPQLSVPYGALFFVFLYISFCYSFCQHFRVDTNKSGL